ncbi:MAG: endonuclease domain-containing protein [Opitutae bacterium]|nr:endonuclease domain-containing protein [Opitutae bacterium]MCD8283657.1 endonuclease domain-containing protein [Opitutae bacterium]
MPDRMKNAASLKGLRRALRKNMTQAEAKLWTYLKNKRFHGYMWHRQFSIGNYILDFFCPSQKLAIELDGQGHATVETYNRDVERTAYLRKLGIRVLRFENKRVFTGWNNVEECILATIEKREPNSPYAIESRLCRLGWEDDGDSGDSGDSGGGEPKFRDNSKP